MKLLKCLVDNIVVDISFNQMGGLITLNFLEEINNLIGNSNIFKRSIILVRLGWQDQPRQQHARQEGAQHSAACQHTGHAWQQQQQQQQQLEVLFDSFLPLQDRACMHAV